MLIELFFATKNLMLIELLFAIEKIKHKFTSFPNVNIKSIFKMWLVKANKAFVSNDLILVDQFVYILKIPTIG